MEARLTTQRVNILGVKVSSVNMEQAVARIGGWIDDRDPNYVCVAPAHAVMECVHDPETRRVYNRSGMTTPDGMGIVWLLKLKGQGHVSRVYGPDLMMAVLEHSISKGWKHFLYGGNEEVVNKLTNSLQARFPGLDISGSFCPPFRPLTPEEDRVAVKAINDARPDIVWIGIGSPKQELWMAEHRGLLQAPVLIGVGAAFDFLSGNKPQAPRWVQRNGLEWIFRFANEPRRLWKRYIQYPYFGLLVIAQILGLKQFPSE